MYNKTYSIEIMLVDDVSDIVRLKNLGVFPTVLEKGMLSHKIVRVTHGPNKTYLGLRLIGGVVKVRLMKPSKLSEKDLTDIAKGVSYTFFCSYPVEVNLEAWVVSGDVHE